MIYIICAFVSHITCQIFKNIFYMIKNREFKILSSGGMPSTHSAFISALTFLIGYKEGFDTSIFALAFIVTLIVCYDAFNVRYESGLHAKILNEKYDLKLHESIGHSLTEVIVGFIYGIIVATIFYIW